MNTHWIGGWVGPRTDMDDKQMRISLTLFGLGTLTGVAQPMKSLWKSKN
jgi:hypothetical protein